MSNARRGRSPWHAVAATIVLVAVVMAACAPTLAGAPAAVPGRPLVAAHRGGALLWPENSLLAFRSALALGVDALEFDLHQTRDGEVVVIHDPTLDRTTTGTGAVADRTLPEVMALRLKGPEGQATTEPIPTLAQVLELVGASRAELLPEIKLDRNRVRYAGIEEQVVALLGAHGRLTRATVQSFDGPTLVRLRELAPSLRTMALVGRGWMRATGQQPRDAVAWAASVHATDLGMDHRLIDPGVVASARQRGMRLSAWTVNGEGDMRRMVDLGADVLMTDRPDLALRLVPR